MSEIQNFLSNIAGAITRKNGSVLAKLLNLPLRASDRMPFTLRLFERLKSVDISSACRTFIPDANYASFIASVLIASAAILIEDYESGRSYFFVFSFEMSTHLFIEQHDSL
jgi:hypothetical protein